MTGRAGQIRADRTKCDDRVRRDGRCSGGRWWEQGERARGREEAWAKDEERVRMPKGEG